jgi:hypothetical protein
VRQQCQVQVDEISGETRGNQTVAKVVHHSERERWQKISTSDKHCVGKVLPPLKTIWIPTESVPIKAGVIVDKYVPLHHKSVEIRGEENASTL